ncbi:MAG TPA: hypothetical protein V6D05_15380 [Stenomitos sp.]
MGGSASRVGSLLVAASLLLSGCGFELFQTASRLATGNAVSALPSWPVDLKAGLGEASLPVSKLLDSGGQLPLVVGDDQTYTLKPEAQKIPTIQVGDNLKVGAQDPLTFPAQTLPDPPLQQTLTGPTLSLDDLGILDIPVGGGMTIGTAIADPGLPDPTLMPAPYAFDRPQSSTVSLADLRKAKLDAGSSLTLTVVNQIAGDGSADQDSMGMTLEDVRILSNGVPINQTWHDTHPSVPLKTGTIKIALDANQILAGSLTVSFRTKGQIPVGFNLKRLDGDQQISIGLGTDVKIKAISLPAKAFPDVSQAFDVPIPDGQGIGSLSDIAIASGSIALHLENGFGVNAAMTIALEGVKNALGAPYVSSVVIPGGGATPAIKDVTLDLAGAVIAGTHVGVKITGQSYDTEAVAPEIPASLVLPDKMAVYKAGQSLSGRVTVGALTFESVSATLNRTVPISSSSTPINLPKELKDLGIGFARVGIQLKINNKSQLPGLLSLDAKAVLPDNSTMPLTYTGNLRMEPALAPGDIKTTILDIDETNSNLVSILNAGAKELQFGGSVAINSGATPVQLTRHDELSGEVAVSVPLSIIFPAMGTDQAVKPYDLKPATPLNLDASTKERLGKGLVTRFVITSMIDNGLHLPLVLNLLFSQTDDPYTDPAPLTKSLALGDGLSTQTSQIEISEAEMAFFKDAKRIGFRLTSPGTKGKPVSLRSTDELRIRLLAELKLRVSPSAFQGSN